MILSAFLMHWTLYTLRASFRKLAVGTFWRSSCCRMVLSVSKSTTAVGEHLKNILSRDVYLTKQVKKFTLLKNELNSVRETQLSLV